MRSRDGQLDLFGAPQSTPPEAEKVALRATRGPLMPAPVAPEVAAAARRLPAGVRIGTSSWTFPGWAGIVYDRAAPPTRLAREGLAVYARHPLLRCVGIDRTYYAPMPAEGLAMYAQAVPDDFRFLVKAHEACTLARFPMHERYGAQRGKTNALFLDPHYATDAVVGPSCEGLKDKAGPLLFQFAPQDVATLGGARHFADRLHAFFSALPRGPLYAVEIRNPQLLTHAYAAALTAAGACHCLNAHPSMPDVAIQAQRTAVDRAPALVIRWMLARGFAYEEAKAHYQPFDRIVDADVTTRSAIAELCVGAAATGRQAFVVINNKAEGSAPLSAFSLAARIVELAGGLPR